MFCYAETSVGTGNTLSAVLSTKISTTTACCKSITYSNTPAFVYGDVSKYSASSTSLYVFTYYLSAAPMSTVRVTPTIYLAGVVGTTVIASPLVTTFTSSSLLTGQFFLSASSITSGTYTVTLAVSGARSSQYSESSTTVQIN